MQAGMVVGNLASAIGITTEDAALVADLKAGSEEAFALLIAQYHQPLYSLIAAASTTPPTPPTSPRKSSSRSSAASAASTATPACAPGSTALPCTRPPTSGAGGRATNGRRSPSTPPSSRRPRRRWRGLLPRCHSRRPRRSPFDHAAQAEVRARVEAALRQLPEAFRTVVILREIEGFAYEEISEILNVNLGTVKSRLTRGRSNLRTLLKRDNVIASTDSASYRSPEASKEPVIS